MPMRLIVLLCCLAYLGEFCQGQPRLVAPQDPDPPGKLAAEATQKLLDWTQSGDLRDILSRPPEEALAGIQAAASKMRDYKNSEVRLYTREAQQLDEMIGKLQGAKVDWKPLIEGHLNTLDRDAANVFEEEQKLQKEIDSLSGDSTPAAQTYLGNLLANRNQLKDLKLRLADQRVLYQKAAGAADADALGPIFDGLRQQR